MLVALLIAAIPLLIIYKLKSTQKVASPFLKWSGMAVIGLLLVQIGLGTQVREQIDEISKGLNYTGRELWIQQLDNMFIIHRSFSWVIAAGCLLLCWKAWRFTSLRSTAILILLSTALTITAGVVMAYFHIPALAQPLHLLLTSILLMNVFALRLQVQ